MFKLLILECLESRFRGVLEDWGIEIEKVFKGVICKDWNRKETLIRRRRCKHERLELRLCFAAFLPKSGGRENTFGGLVLFGIVWPMIC